MRSLFSCPAKRSPNPQVEWLRACSMLHRGHTFIHAPSQVSNTAVAYAVSLRWLLPSPLLTFPLWQRLVLLLLQMLLGRMGPLSRLLVTARPPEAITRQRSKNIDCLPITRTDAFHEERNVTTHSRTASIDEASFDSLALL